MIYFIVSAKGNIYDVKFLVGNISFERSLKKALLKSSGMCGTVPFKIITMSIRIAR
jgi:hypothetical protein